MLTCPDTLGTLRLVVRWCSSIGTLWTAGVEIHPILSSFWRSLGSWAVSLQDCFCSWQSVATQEGVVEIQCDPWLKIRAYLAHHLQNFCCFRCAGSARIIFYRWGSAAAPEFRFEYCPTDPTGSLKFGGCEMLPTRGKFGCSFLFNTAEHRHSKSTGFSKASCDAECSFWPSLWDCSTKSSPFLLSPTQPEIKAPKPTAGFVNSLNAADLWLP